MLSNDELKIFQTDSLTVPGLVNNNDNNFNFQVPLLSSGETQPEDDQTLRIASQLIDDIEVNNIDGTPGLDNLVGTEGDDLIIGSQGQDTITGGDGNDTFVYTNVRHRSDIITDFELGKDKIDLTEVLDAIGFTGDDPIESGHVGLQTNDTDVIVTIAAGRRRAVPFVTLQDLADDVIDNESFLADVLGLSSDGSVPIVSAELLNDTGDFDTDNITSDPTIIGNINTETEVVSLTAGFNETSVEDFVDVTTGLLDDGSFELDQELLEDVLGENLTNGTYTLKLQATDSDGNLSEVIELEFTLDLDVEVPVISAELLNDTGDSDTDNITSDPTIIGTINTESEIVSLTAGFNETSVEDFVDVTTGLLEDGSFELDEELLEDVLGENLTNGTYTLKLQATDSDGNLSEVIELEFTLDLEVEAPVISAELANDTGDSDTDNITSEPTIVGTVNIESGIVGLTAGFNDTPTEEFVDITDALLEDGTFELDREFLEDILGETLTNGTYTLKLQTIDNDNNLSEVIELEFTLDLDVEVPVISAELANDTGEDDTDNITSEPTIIGNINTESEVVSLKAGFNDTPVEEFVDVTAALSEDGTFELDQEFLEEVLGETLTDGTYFLNIQATNSANISSEIVEIELSLDTVAPEIFVELANDTGESDTDKLTADPTVIANVLDDSEIVSLKAGLNNNSTADFIDLTAELEINGSLELTPELLEEMLGDVLTDGTYTLYFQAVDEHEFSSDIIELKFTFSETEIDRPGPEILSLAEIYGLDTYPDAISLPTDGTRQLSVKVDEWLESPELTIDIGDISYTVADESILEVSDEGLVTATGVGETTITVNYGDASATIPVLVEEPEPGAARVDENGGVVEGADGSLVMVPPGALNQETTVNLTPLEQQDLSMPIPEGLEFVGAFGLELGETALNEPAQLAIPAPADFEEGSGVLFLRQGQMPDASGTWRDTWLIEEIGVAGSDGMIRTTSFPYPGIGTTLPIGSTLAQRVVGTRVASFVGSASEYIMLRLPEVLEGLNAIVPFQRPPYVTPTQQSVDDYIGSLDEIRDLINVQGALSRYQYLGARAGLIGLIATSYAQFLLTSVLAAYVATLDDSSLDIIGIPEVGPPVGKSTSVVINSEGLPTYSVEIDAPIRTTADPLLGPVLQSAELKFDNNSPYISLRGSNFLNDFEGGIGNRFEDLIVKFYVGGQVYEMPVIPGISRELDDNQFEIGVEIPVAVPVGQAKISVSRKQERRIGVDINDIEVVELESDSELRLSHECAELALVSQRTADTISVIDVLGAGSVVEGTSSADLLRAKISVGTPDESDVPGELAATSNGTMAYVPLEESGKVAIVDLMALRQVDGMPETPEVEPIALPEGATPMALTIDKQDEYAYIADKNGGKVYVLDINPDSDSYHQVVETIELELNNESAQLREVAISADGRRLFVTASYSRIYVVNIDPNDRPLDEESNERKWWQQIGAVTATGAMGLSATTDPLKMTFTSGQFDGQGFGALEIVNDDPLAFEATTKYTSLSLDVFWDYFDVDRGVAVTIMKDGSYAFVAGRDTIGNTKINSREGGNIGIIKDPLGDNPELVAATRPIPGSLTNNVVLSGDDKYLIGSYPTLSLGGAAYVFDVEEMIETIETLELKANGEDSDESPDYWLDSRNRGEGSVAFDEGSKREATFGDLEKVPIDDINPDISVAADFEIIGGNWVNQFTFGVPEGTQRSPIGIGGSPMGLTSVSVRDVAELRPIIETVENGSVKRTLNWGFNIEGEGENEEHENDCLMAIEPQNVQEVNLYVSVFPEGQGLLPSDKWDELEEKPGLENLEDYNPNRVLTATAKWNPTKQKWIWKSGDFESEVSSLPQEFTLPDELKLTGGQTYHWAVEVVQNGIKYVNTRDFEIPLAATGGSDTFSSVTVLTNGVEPGNTTDTSESINDIARQIEAFGGSVMRYEPTSQEWESVSYSQGSGEWNSTDSSPELGKPLVLLADWVDESDIDGYQTAGLAEAAADGLFSSLVDFDLDYGGTVGGSESLYAQNGDLIRSQGAVFNSPLHFIGFGQGAVVNTEIVQRLGTYFPDAGGFDAENRDLHFTTVDPLEYTPETVPQFEDTYARMLDPEIVIWDNVTYADNYYQQQVPEGDKKAIRGQLLTGVDNNQKLEQWAGFDPAQESDHPHRAAVSWYGGTANLNESHVSDEKQQVFRRLGDLLAEGFSSDDNDKSWFVPGHVNANFPHGDQNAPWEGIGTGWFYSVNGGGDKFRPYFVNGEKKSRGDLGNFDEFQEYLKDNRRSVSDDNTYKNQMILADYEVPTLFNGNFDAIALNRSEEENIPGWSYSNSALQKNLVDWDNIFTLAKYREDVGYDSFTPRSWALQMGGKKTESSSQESAPIKSITHNPFVVPDWGVLRFDLHVPESSIGDGKLKVFIQPLDSPNDPGEENPDAEILLKKAINSKKSVTRTSLNGSTYSVDIPKNYEANQNKIGYGVNGFETFHVDIDPELRGKPAILKFELEGDGPIYLDNVFFKSESLRWGNPTEARNEPSSQYQNNFLIEKPQYSLSYNQSKNTINWVAWKLDKSWLGKAPRPDNFGFAEDTGISGYKVQDSDYDPLYLRSQDGTSVKNTDLLQIDRGHLAPRADRTRSRKDVYATFLTTNLLPQQRNNNQGIWSSLEEHLRNVVRKGTFSYQHPDTYIIAGGFEQNKEYTGISQNENLDPLINLPLGLWKTALTVGDNKYQPPTASHFGVYMGNAQRSNWLNFTEKIQDLENLLNSDDTIKNNDGTTQFQYKFLTSNVPESLVEDIKGTNKIIYPKP